MLTNIFGELGFVCREFCRYLATSYDGCPPGASAVFLFTSVHLCQILPHRRHGLRNGAYAMVDEVLDVTFRLLMPYISYKLVWLPVNSYLHDCLRFLLGNSQYLGYAMEISSLCLSGLFVVRTIRYSFTYRTNEDIQDNIFQLPLQLRIAYGLLLYNTQQLGNAQVPNKFSRRKSFGARLESIALRHLLSKKEIRKTASEPILRKSVSFNRQKRKFLIPPIRLN